VADPSSKIYWLTGIFRGRRALVQNPTKEGPMNRAICVFTLATAGSLVSTAGAQHRGAAVPASRQPDRSNFTAETLEQRMATNPNLASRVQSLLPPGTSLQAAASGFKDEGQFIAALHVSRNLNIPFNELKADLSKSKYGSLGRALHDLRPELHSRVIDSQVKRAERQTKTDLQQQGDLAINSVR
jgi:hypothetical protein